MILFPPERKRLNKKCLLHLPILRACYCWDRFAFYLHDGQEGARCRSSPAHSCSLFYIFSTLYLYFYHQFFSVCISSISHLYFPHPFPIPIHPQPPITRSIWTYASFIPSPPPERHLMLVLHRPLWQYGSSPNPIFCSSHEATVKHQLGNRKHDRRGSNFDNWEGAAVVVGRGCSTSCLLHCPPLFAPPHCLPLPTRQPITRQSFKKGHSFYLPPMSAFNAVFCHQSVTFLQQEKKTFGDVEILKCRLC